MVGFSDAPMMAIDFGRKSASSRMSYLPWQTAAYPAAGGMAEDVTPGIRVTMSASISALCEPANLISCRQRSEFQTGGMEYGLERQSGAGHRRRQRHRQGIGDRAR